MDNAVGGARGLRANPTPELMAAIQREYRLTLVTDPVDLGGSSCLTLGVNTNRGRYVIRVYRPYVEAARLHDINLARTALSANDVPCPKSITTIDGQAWVVVDGRLVEVEEYIVHDANMDSLARLEIGLPRLGQIHTILRDLDVSAAGRNPRFANHIEARDVVAQTRLGTDRIRGWRQFSAELALANAADDLARWVSQAEQELVPHLPRQLVHGDFWDNNVFLRDGRVVLVTDFDFMGERARIDDLALTLYFAGVSWLANPASADLSPMRRLIDAYTSGLDQPLSSLERAALPLAIARQPLWSIGGWVAQLDDEAAARRHAAGMVDDVNWALQLMDDMARWQAAFA